MAKIHIDGKEYEVDGSKNLLEACLALGLDIPYFCWHPALGSVGSCRQCAVKQYKDKDDTMGRLVMSCMTPTNSDIYISIKDAEAVEFRASVIEWLMTNHPHDCPVCEEGGNCHLQDMTVMSGHTKRQYRFPKRTHNNQELGPFIAHEMNRCIACYRCVRYYRDYADGTDFGVYGAHNNLYFGRVEEGVLESEFSGNLVEVCPTGVFTDKTHSERYNRKWDMQFAPSICQQCSVGCNISPGERYGELRRIENRFNGAVNHYFLCDRGRFGYGYVNSEERSRQPLLKQDDNWVKLDKCQAVKAAKAILSYAKGVIAIGSPRASLESNLMLRQLVGESQFFSGINETELAQLHLIQHILKEGGVHTPSLAEIEQYDAVIILGEDVTQTAARIALAVRQALKAKRKVIAAEFKISDWLAAAVDQAGQNERYPLFITSTDQTRLADVATWQYLAPIEDQVSLAYRVAHHIDSQAPMVTECHLESEILNKASDIAHQLMQAKRPLIITGTSSGDKRLIEAAYNLAHALKQQGINEVGLTFVVPECNSMGVSLLEQKSVEQGLACLESGQADTLIVLENDLYRRASLAKISAALAKTENIIVIDHQTNLLTSQADLLLTAATFAEGDGTLINQEGRVQRFFQVFDPAFYNKDSVGSSAEQNSPENQTALLESWRWLAAVQSLVNNADHAVDWSTLDNTIEQIIKCYPDLVALRQTAPAATFRIKGMRLAREPVRYSGRTAMLANVNVHEPAQPTDVDSAFCFSMEGYSGFALANQQIPFAWAPGWNSPQAWNKFQQEIGREVRGGNPGVRLFEATASTTLEFFPYQAVTRDPAVRQVVACYHLFGSDETSQKSPPIAQRMPSPYLLLNDKEALQLGLKEGEWVECQCQGETMILPLKTSQHLAVGLVGLPLGLPALSPALVGCVIESLKGAH